MNYLHKPFKDRPKDILDRMPVQGHNDRSIIMVIGAGGLGCAVLPRIVRSRPSRLIIVDGDVVEPGNLDRQPLYAAVDVGHPKASTAAMWLRQVSPLGTVKAVDAFLDANNAHEQIEQADIVVEGVDDLHAKGLIDRVCVELDVPLISGGVHQQHGQVLTLHAPGPDRQLTRAGIFAGTATSAQDDCDMRDVRLGLLEEVGGLMARRCADLMAGRPVRNGRLELFDGVKWLTIDPGQ